MNNKMVKYYYYKCSVCGKIHKLNIFEAVSLRYCRNCGQYIRSIFG
jgi:predicted nucleic acid-binding Zn ribbon protein